MKCRLLVLLYCSLLVNVKIFTQGQDTISLYEKNTLKFARYLMVNKEFQFASEEYLKLNYLYPQKKEYFSEWLTCSRQANRLDLIQQRLTINVETPKSWQLEYALACINAKKLGLARQVIDNGKLMEDPSIKLKAGYADLGLKLLENKYSKHKEYASSHPELQSIMIQYNTQKYKSVALAGIASGLLPGAGRIYTKDYANGAISMLFIASTLYQAYSRFDKNGVKSVGGWIYASIGTGFYLGNIYGSIKSAKRYNQKLKAKIDEKTYHFINGL
jgi:hypothetical protein